MVTHGRINPGVKNHLGALIHRTTSGFMISLDRVLWVHVEPSCQFGVLSWNVRPEDSTEPLKVSHQALLDAVDEAIFICTGGQLLLDVTIEQRERSA